MISQPDGILVRSGKYRTFGEDLLLLTDIKGSFYARPGTEMKSFTDEDYMYGEKLLQVEQKTDDKDNPISLSIAGEATFLPIKEAD
jgi:hypothetical protein